MSNEEVKKPSKAKKFFTSKVFKWIMILILEFASLLIFSVVSDSPGDSMITKPFLIYYGICIVLSIGAIFRLSNARSKAKREANRGVIHIMSEQEYTYKQTGDICDHMVFLFIASIVVSPLAAPVTVGTMIHKLLCMTLK